MKPKRHIVWSTNEIDLSDPFQRTWYLRQVLLYGRTEDIQTLDLREVWQCLDDLNLPDHIDSLWRSFLGEKFDVKR